MRVGHPGLLDGGDGVSAADHREGAGVDHRPRHPEGARGEGAFSNTPIGPFQMIVPAPLSAAANCATVAGPMSSPMRSPGNLPHAHRAEPLRCCRARRGHHVDRQPQRHAGAPRSLEHGARRLEPVRLRAASGPTPWPSAARNVKAIPPPIRSPSTRVEQVLDEGQLVRNLGSAQQRAQTGRSGRSKMRPSASSSRCHEQAGRGRASGSR